MSRHFQRVTNSVYGVKVATMEPKTQQRETTTGSVSIVGRSNHVRATVVNTGQSHFSLPVQPGVSVFRGTTASLQPLTKALLSKSPASSAIVTCRSSV